MCLFSWISFAYAEQQSRYHLNDCLMSARRAEKAADGWVLSGEKVWVLNGHAADQIIVAARTGGGQLDDSGLSLFIVDAEAPGLTRVRVPGMDGQRTAVLRFEDSGADTASTMKQNAREQPAPAPAETSKERIARAFGEGSVTEKPLDEVVLDYLVQNARKRKKHHRLPRHRSRRLPASLSHPHFALQRVRSRS